MKSIIFASHIPNPSRLYVGKEFLDKFLELFSGYDIYIGINNSCKEWYNLLDEYSSRLNISYATTSPALLVDSDASAFQTAISLLKATNKRYDLYWFGHTKGATSGCDDFRQHVFNIFWNRKEVVEKRMELGYSIYSPFIGMTTPGYLNTTLPIIVDGKDNDDLSGFYTFWVHSGEVINKFLERCKPIFFEKKITLLERTIEDRYGRFCDRYFFERDFPMIYQKLADNPKLLYDEIVIHDIGRVNYIKQNCDKLEL
jgi:hypothetical protein